MYKMRQMEEHTCTKRILWWNHWTLTTECTFTTWHWRFQSYWLFIKCNTVSQLFLLFSKYQPWDAVQISALFKLCWKMWGSSEVRWRIGCGSVVQFCMPLMSLNILCRCNFCTTLPSCISNMLHKELSIAKWTWDVSNLRYLYTQVIRK